MAAIGLAGGIVGAGLAGTGVLPLPHAGLDKTIHEYILSHPEILPEAMERLRQDENRQQLALLRGPLETPWPGAVLGNPQGKITLVEFTDYACGYCRRSVSEVAELIQANPDLRVVVRELPILTPQSADAAGMALAAAAQGKYAAFREAMFALGQPSRDSIAQAARSAGLDMAAANKALANPDLKTEFARNTDLARQLGFSGTPSWVVGNAIYGGAVGKEALSRAIAAARG